MNDSDKREFLAQYEEIHEALMRFCIVKSRGIMDAKDLANDTLLVGLENYNKLKDKKALLSYLFTTATHICANKIRRKKFSAPYNENMAHQIIDPNNNIESKVDISVLYAALDQLPALQKEALILFEISDLPIKEIMVIQKSGSSAVKQRIKRGREKLAALLQEKKKRKIAVITTLLLTTNSFGMTKLDTYFQAVKDLPLPLDYSEAASTVTQFQMAGAATNAAATKLGTVIVKKSLIGTFILGGAITGVTLISSSSEAQPEHYENPVESKVVIQKEVPKATASIVPFDRSEKEMVLSEEEMLIEESTFPLTDTHSTATAFTIPIENKGIYPSSNITLPELTSSAAPQVEDFVITGGESHSMEGIETLVIHYLGDNVTVQTWDKDEVKIDFAHEIEAKSEEDEQFIREHLKHTVTKEGDKLKIYSEHSYKRRRNRPIGKFNLIHIGGKRIKYKKIVENYIIHIPAQVNLELEGYYRHLDIPSIKGNVTSSLRSTNLTMGDIDGDVKLKLNYCNTKIGQFNGGKISVLDGDLEFGDTKELKLNAQYANVIGQSLESLDLDLFDTEMTLQAIKTTLKAELEYSDLVCESSIENAELSIFDGLLKAGAVNQLKVSLQYSKLDVTEIGHLKMPVVFDSHIITSKINSLYTANSKYSNYKIGELNGAIEIVSFDDDLTISKTTSDKDSMVFSGQYSNYTIALNQSIGYQLEFSGNYSDIDYRNITVQMRESHSKDEHSEIKGFIKNGNEDSAMLKFDCFDSKVILK